MPFDRHLADVMEAALDLEADDTTWLAGVARALENHAGEGYGCVASLYAPNDTSIGFNVVLGPGIPAGLEARTVFEATTQTTPEFIRQVYRELTYETTSGLGPACERQFHSHVHDWGIRDAICLNAPLGDDRGAAFLISQPRRRRIRMGEHRWFGDVAALLRLAVRRRRGQGPGGVSVLARARATVDARGREAERLRAAGFQQVRELEEDGRRRLVVEPVRLGALAVLAPRERAAVLLLATTGTNEEIAARLGTTKSTVGVLLHRAAAKLRVRSRSELVALAVEAATDANDDPTTAR